MAAVVYCKKYAKTNYKLKQYSLEWWFFVTSGAGSGMIVRFD